MNTEEFRALERNLANHRIVARSPDGTVSATVTGAGDLVDIAITDQSLRGQHPQMIGPAIVAAIQHARQQAARYERDKFQAGPAGSVTPVAARRAGQVDCSEESDLFQGFGRVR